MDGRTGEVSREAPAPGPTPLDRVRELARLLARLGHDADVAVDDPEACQRLAAAVKPFVDRLVAMRRLLHPLGRIIDKRDRILELQDGIAADVAHAEHVSVRLSESIDPSLLNELQAELATVKRDRKLFTDNVDEHLTKARTDPDRREPAPPGPERSRAVPLLERPVEERLRLLLGRRFIDLEQLARVLGHGLPEDEIRVAPERLERFWAGLMALDRFRMHAQAGRVPPLRRAFRDYVLVYRTTRLTEPQGALTPCALRSLRRRFPDRFSNTGDGNLWYGRLPFYGEPLPEGHWALLDSQYLNCTFKRPKIRLLMYARANDLPAPAVRQKSILEDVYDRVVVDSAMERTFFEDCNSLTRTSYQQKGERSQKQAYVYEREGRIRLSGKRGVPHWRPGRPRWPGVLPSVVFDERAV